MLRGLLATLAVAVPAAAADDPAKAIQDKMAAVRDRAAGGVVGVVASHHKYPPVPAHEAGAGKLGKFVPRQVAGRAALFQPVLAEEQKLDLSRVENVADNQFGSGIVLDKAKQLVLTNYHLVEGASKVYVRVSKEVGSYANVHAADARSDLAVLQLIDPVEGLTEIPFADVRTEKGPNGQPPTLAEMTWVIALGHPHAAGFADGTPTASFGIVGGLRRRAPGPGREEQRVKPLHQYGVLIQTDARVALGCSGGALLNLDGKLIGMTTPLAALVGADTGGGFAIPFDQNYVRIVNALKTGTEVEYGFLGVSVNADVPGRLENGLHLVNVVRGTPADAAGLVGGGRGFPGGGDIITAIDGHTIREQDDLFLRIGAALAGSTVRLSVVKQGGQRREVEVVLAKQEHPFPWVASARPDPVFGLRVEYSSVLLARTAADAPIGQAVPTGVGVRELEPNSPAAARFKALGPVPSDWLITRVNDAPVKTPAEFYAAARGKAQVTLRVVDPRANGGSREVVLP